MVEFDLKSLLKNNNTVFDANSIPEKLLNDVDNEILTKQDKISSEVLNVYQKFIPMKDEAPKAMKNELFSTIRNFAKEKFSKNENINALMLYRFLMVKTKLIPADYDKIAEIFIKSENFDLAINFAKIYENVETNKPLKYLTMANFYNLGLKDYEKAIKYYELYLQIDETKSVIYTILANLYSKMYGDNKLKQQIYYWEKAYNLKPDDRLVLHSLAFGYEKLGEISKAETFYKKLLENNPTETDYYNYGTFLISCGNFELGHKYFTHRFLIDDANLKYPLQNEIDKKWDFKSDISDKTLLVHYEQGFGDTFMYCRFVPYLKNIAKEVIFVVQENLADLIKYSSLISEDIKIVTNIDEIKYDVNMALLDVPHVLNFSSKNIPFPEGYLEVPKSKIINYAQKYIKNSSNLKVGISCQGSKSANYSERDVDFSLFSELLKMKNVDFYSFDLDFEAENIICLGKTFNNFTDTACALKNMDIVISTDNVILNLTGALGIKTYGLFNKYPNFRWFKLDGNDVGWYKSVIPIKLEENSNWSLVFGKLYNIINVNDNS